MVVPLGIGLWLDHELDSGPWATIGGMFLGFVGGLLHLISLARQSEREQSKKNGS
jgi:F0F1-type ATP synthase assembly protein I